MTPEDLNNALQSAALTYVREVKQRGTSLCGHQELAVDIICKKQYQHRKLVDTEPYPFIVKDLEWASRYRLAHLPNPCKDAQG